MRSAKRIISRIASQYAGGTGPSSAFGPPYSSPSANRVDIALLAKFAKSGHESAIHGAEGGAADMGKQETVHTVPSGFAADIDGAGLATDSSNKPDRPVPASRIRKKQIGTGSPGRKL